jgi:hypothetical protein
MYFKYNVIAGNKSGLEMVRLYRAWLRVFNVYDNIGSQAESREKVFFAFSGSVQESE